MKRTVLIFTMLLCGVVASGQEKDPITDSLLQVVENGHDTARLDALGTLGRLNLGKDLGVSAEYIIRALELARSIGSLSDQSQLLTTLGAIRFYQGSYNQAKEDWLNAISVTETRMEQADDSLLINGLKDNLGQLYNNVGLIHKNNGEYDKAIEYYQMNLRIQEEIQNSLIARDMVDEAASYFLNMARGMANIANVYYFFAVDPEQAMDYYQQSLELFTQYAEQKKDDPGEYANGLTGMANTYLNIGNMYKEEDTGMKDNGKALENFRLALDIAQELEDAPLIANIQSLMALVYLDRGSYEEAEAASRKALETYRAVGRRKEVATTLKDLGVIYFEWGRYEESLDYYNQSLAISQELQLKKEVYDTYEEIAEVYEMLNNYKQAFEYYKDYSTLKDSSIKEENLKIINEMQTKYETERVENQNALLEAKNLAQEANIKRQRLFLFGLIAIALIIAGFGTFAFRQWQAKQRANVLLEEQNIEIKTQRDQIFQQKQEITDSIHYASRIQNAVLPRETVLDRLSDHFILFKPRDIVSGDFYWMTEKDGKTFVMAADCTGHGVPGAFMSMLGISFMNEIVNKSDQSEANLILDQLRENVVKSLHQTGEEGEQKDGMDLALCVIDNDLTNIQYSGAYNPLYLIRDGELTEYKADKMPIGIYAEKDNTFTNNRIEVKKGDNLYMFSDGYVDQFGGDKGKKFMSKKFKQLLVSISAKPMKEQREILDRTIEEWKGRIEQIDDIIVMGFRI